MDQRVVLQDGVPQADGQVTLDADDRTFLLGCGVFETLRTYGGVLYGMDAHLARLHSSAQRLGIDFPGVALLASELQMAASGIDGEAVVRVTLTHSGRRIVRASMLQPALQGYRCVTRQWTPPAWLDGSVKHTSRAHSVLAVEASGADEVLWVDADGFLLEGTRSNVFGVIDGVFCTPALDGRLLAGVTRSDLLSAAADAGIATAQRPLHCDAGFDELYLSSTLKELSPISELDGAAAPGGGLVGQAVSEAFLARVGR